MVTTRPQTTNWVPNPSFETNTTDWAFTDATTSRVTDIAFSGTYALELTATAAEGCLAQMTEKIPIDDDQSVYVAARALARQADASATIRIGFWDSFDEIIGSYDQEIANTPGLRAYWRLNEATAGPVIDSSVNGLSGTNNGATINQPGLISTDPDTAYTFDGTNDYISVGSTSVLNIGGTTPYSVEFWWRSGSLPAGDDTFFNIGSVASVYIQSGTGYWAHLRSGQNSFAIKGPQVNTTYHIVAVYDGAEMLLYVNGEEVSSAATTTSIPSINRSLTIGAWTSGSNFMPGTIDEFAFYNVALPLDTILDHYELGATSGQVSITTDEFEWSTLEFHREAPAGAVNATLHIAFETLGGSAVGDKYLLDAVELRVDQALDTYFDGDTEGATWTGTAHASASIRAAEEFTLVQSHDSEHYTVAYRIWSVDDDLNDDIELTEWVDGGSISCNIDEDVKRSAKFNFKNLAVLDPFVTRLKVYMEKYVENVLIDNEPLGVYSIDMPDGTVEYKSRFGTVEANDITVELADSSRGKQFVYTKGTNIVGNAENRITAGRGYQANFPIDGKLFTKTEKFPPWMGDLELVNKLLEMANFHGCYGDGNGIIRTQKIRKLSEMNPIVHIHPWEVFEIIETNDVENLCNVVKVYKDDPDGDPLFVIRKNDDPTDPVSIVNMRYKALVLSESEVDSTGEAIELAERKLEEGKSFDKTLKIVITPNPYLGINNVLQLTFDQEDGTCYCGKYWIREWDLPLGPPFFQTVTINRVQKFHDGMPE